MTRIQFTRSSEGFNFGEDHLEKLTAALRAHAGPEPTIPVTLMNAATRELQRRIDLHAHRARSYHDAAAATVKSMPHLYRLTRCRAVPDGEPADVEVLDDE